MNPTPPTANRDAAAVVVFCRRPQPGVGKQRLAAGVGREAAHAIAGALLACTLEDLDAWTGPVVLAPAAAQDIGWARSLLGARAQVLAQPEGNLGERLEAIDLALRQRGHRRLLFIGTDAPALPTGFLASAAAALDLADVVLAPARDGGVTLMGARRPWPPLGALPWSTPSLGAALEAACRARGDSIARLAESVDVDEAADLDWVCEALAGDARAARRELCRLAAASRRGATGAAAGWRPRSR
jgi:rSAM/selenodomain-associated transferase 1